MRESAYAPLSGASIGRAGRPVARVGLVARGGAAVPERVVHGGGGGGAVGLDEQLDGVQRAGPDLDLLGRVVREALLLVDAGDELGVEAQDAVDAQHVRDEVVGEQR